MNAWVAKVERLGRLHAASRIKGLKARHPLIIDAVIAPNGQLIDIDIQQSSGVDKIDQTAREIIQLAAPYPPYNESLPTHIRQLHILRHWRFSATE